MKTSTQIIQKLAKLGVFETEPVGIKKDNDVIIKDEYEQERRVILDDVTDEEIPLFIAAEQLHVIKRIKFYVKTSFIIGLCGIGLAGILFLLGRINLF